MWKDMTEKVPNCFRVDEVGIGERKTATHFEILHQLTDHNFHENRLPYNYFTSSSVKVKLKFTLQQTT